MKQTKADLARENAALRRELEERRRVGNRMATILSFNFLGELARSEWDRIERTEESR